MEYLITLYFMFGAILGISYYLIAQPMEPPPPIYVWILICLTWPGALIITGYHLISGLIRPESDEER